MTVWISRSSTRSVEWTLLKCVYRILCVQISHSVAAAFTHGERANDKNNNIYVYIKWGSYYAKPKQFYSIGNVYFARLRYVYTICSLYVWMLRPLLVLSFSIVLPCVEFLRSAFPIRCAEQLSWNFIVDWFESFFFLARQQHNSSNRNTKLLHIECAWLIFPAIVILQHFDKLIDANSKLAVPNSVNFNEESY